MAIRIPDKILNKKPSQLTLEEKELLKQWFLQTRSKRSIAMDLKRTSHRVPRKVGSWIKHPNKYDIPGIDLPEALPYKPKHRKIKQNKENIDEVWGKLSKIITEKMSKLSDTLSLVETMSNDIIYLDYEGKLKDADIEYYRKQLEEIKEKLEDYEKALRELKTNVELLRNNKKYIGWYNDLKRVIPIWGKRIETIKRILNNIKRFLDEKEEEERREILIEKMLDDVFSLNETYKLLKNIPFIYNTIIKGTQTILDNWPSYEKELKDVYVRTIIKPYEKHDQELIKEHEGWFERQVSNKSGKQLLNELAYLFNTDTLLALLYRIGNNLSIEPREIYVENRKMLSELKEILPKTEALGYDILKTQAISPKYEKRLISNMILRILLHPSIKEKLFSIKKELNDSLKTDYTVFTVESQEIESPNKKYYNPSLYLTLKKAIPTIISDYETLHGNPEYIIRNFYHELGLYGESQRKIGVKPVLTFKGVENGYPIYEYKIMYNDKVIDQGVVAPEWQDIASSIASQISREKLLPYLIRNNIEVYPYSEKDTGIVVQYTDEGAKILYSPNTNGTVTIPYNDIHRFIKTIYLEGGDQHQFIEALKDFKNHATKHGIEYPAMVSTAIETIYKNPRPIFYILKVIDPTTLKEKYAFYRREGWEDTVIEADTLDELIEKVQNAPHYKVKPNIKRALYEAIEKGYLKTGSNIGKRFVTKDRFINNIEAILDTYLEYNNDIKGYIGPLHILGVFDHIPDEIIKHITPQHISGKQANNINYYIELDVNSMKDIYLRDKFISELKKRNIPYKIIDENTILVDATKVPKTLLQRYYGRYYPSYVSVYLGNEKIASYLYLYDILRKLGNPEELWIKKNEPIILKYGNWYIAVAPKLQ